MPGRCHKCHRCPPYRLAIDENEGFPDEVVRRTEMQERRVLLNHEQDDLDPVEGRKDHAEGRMDGKSLMT